MDDNLEGELASERTTMGELTLDNIFLFLQSYGDAEEIDFLKNDVTLDFTSLFHALDISADEETMKQIRRKFGDDVLGVKECVSFLKGGGKLENTFNLNPRDCLSLRKFAFWFQTVYQPAAVKPKLTRETWMAYIELELLELEIFLHFLGYTEEELMEFLQMDDYGALEMSRSAKKRGRNNKQSFKMVDDFVLEMSRSAKKRGRNKKQSFKMDYNVCSFARGESF